MKKQLAMFCVLVLSMSLLSGCRITSPNDKEFQEDWADAMEEAAEDLAQDWEDAIDEAARSWSGRDENGVEKDHYWKVLDENGSPIEESYSSVGWGNGFMVDIYSTSQEEYDQIMALYNAIDLAYRENRDLNGIVISAAEAYFAGDKSLDEAAALIQSRAAIYVGEQQ